MRRREYLALCATAGIGALAGCPSVSPDESRETPTSTPGRPRTEAQTTESWERTVDIVDAGADPTGGERIDPILQEQYDSNTRLVLPEGRYRLGQQVFDDVDRLALVGDDATLVPAAPDTDILLSFQAVSNLYVDGLTVDQSSGRGCGCFYVRCTGGDNLLRDVTFDGFVDKRGRVDGFRLFCEGADTQLTLDGIDMRDGARNGLGVFVFPRRLYPDPERRAGSVTFSNVFMRGWGREGLYASAHGGSLSVLGGRYENNAIDQVRVGGGGSDTDATVQNVTVRVADPPAYVVDGDYGNLRGIWLEEGDDAVVKDCDVHVESLNGAVSQGAIVVGEQFGRATIRDTTVRTDVDVPGIRIQEPTDEYDRESIPSMSDLPDAYTVTCENLDFRGSSAEGATIHLRGRDDCTLEDLALDHRQGTRHGLVVEESLRTSIDGGRWVTSGYPALIGDADTGSEGGVLACFGQMSDLRSTRFTGQRLRTRSDIDGGQAACIPVTALRNNTQNPYDPYVGVTGLGNRSPEGRRLVADYDGSRVTTR